MRKSLLALMLFLISYATLAETTRYITASSQVKMRSDVGEKALIIQYLLPGTKLAELGMSPDKNYLRVRLASGMEGWVPSRVVGTAPPVNTSPTVQQPALPVVTGQMLAGKPAEPTEAHIQQLTEQLSGAQQQLAFLRDAAARPKQLEEENGRLQHQVVSMQNDMRLLQEQNLLLQDKSGKEGFVIGAIVFFAGLVFGLLVPRLLPRKKSMWKEL